MADPYAPPGSSRAPTRQPGHQPPPPGTGPEGRRPGAGRRTGRRPPPRPSGPQPPPRPADRGEGLRAARLTVRFALLVVLGLLLQSVDRDELLVQLAALALLLGAAAGGVGALRSALRAGLGPGVRAVLGVGLFATALLVLLQVLVLVAWPVTSQQARCTARALTHQAQEACTPAAARHLEELLGS